MLQAIAVTDPANGAISTRQHRESVCDDYMRDLEKEPEPYHGALRAAAQGGLVNAATGGAFRKVLTFGATASAQVTIPVNTESLQ